MKTIIVWIALFFISNLSAHGISPQDAQSMLDAGNIQYIWLGATHMLSGYDHLLFLFGIVFFLSSLKDIIKFITVFTLGHSLTLVFATFNGISANYYLVDAVIAISVIYKAFDNNKYFESYLGVKSPNLLIMVLIFGLIHGFGLSTRLQQLPLGEHNTDMLLRILSFNVGVELGQILALLGMLFVLNIWRKFSSFKKFAKVVNDALILAGFLLFLMQMHGYLHVVNEEEFGFNRDEHHHIHQDMQEAQKSSFKHDKL